jgi:hypothetical protein
MVYSHQSSCFSCMKNNQKGLAGLKDLQDTSPYKSQPALAILSWLIRKSNGDRPTKWLC